MPMESTAPALKPQLRGVLHQVSFFIAALAGAWLLTRATGSMFWACAVYVVALCGQFAVSALYHRPTWSAHARQWWRRVDHSMIMILIAGTATPLAVGMRTEASRTLLTILWTGAAIGVLRALFWIRAPKWVPVVVALVLAWLIAPFVPDVKATLGQATLTLMVVGGVLYSVGAVVYALKRPDPWPRMFGYHEVFHAFVCLAAVLHFIAVSRVVLMRG